MNTTNKLALPGLVVTAALLGVAGTSIVNSLSANAATDTSGTSSGTTSQSQSSGSATTAASTDQPRGPHTANGKTEELLTDDTAEKVKAAALAKYPGGTIIRVETDADGATYEAHMTKSDGTPITVLFDANFNITGTEDGPGGHGGQRGMDDSASGTSSSSGSQTQTE